jgi:hypothetical protein
LQLQLQRRPQLPQQPSVCLTTKHTPASEKIRRAPLKAMHARRLRVDPTSGQFAGTTCVASFGDRGRGLRFRNTMVHTDVNRNVALRDSSLRRLIHVKLAIGSTQRVRVLVHACTSSTNDRQEILAHANGLCAFAAARLSAVALGMRRRCPPIRQTY